MAVLGRLGREGSWQPHEGPAPYPGGDGEDAEGGASAGPRTVHYLPSTK